VAFGWRGGGVGNRTFIKTQFTRALPLTEYWNPVSCLGYSKLVISFVKYTPAAYWNYKRKSTKGWSIFNILCDFTGGVFSIASGALSVSNGLNISKLVLAIISIFFDLIFIFQHYVLYRKKNVQTNERM
jgi:cystinosin